MLSPLEHSECIYLAFLTIFVDLIKKTINAVAK